MLRALVLVLALALAGCGATTPAPAPSLEAAGSNCPGAVLPAEQARFGAGEALAGALLGTGKIGVVLAHMAPGSLCEWLPYGRALAERGYRVLAFDFNGAGSSEFTAQKNDLDVAEAVAFLRGKRVSQTILIGASRGGTAVVTAGSKVSPPVDAVASVSAPAAFAGMDAREAAAKLTVPVLYIAADMDGTYAEQAKNSTSSVSRAQTGVSPSFPAHSMACHYWFPASISKPVRPSPHS